MIRIVSDASTKYSSNISIGSYLIYDASENLIYKESFKIEDMDNNYCELYTIYKAIKYSYDNNITNITVFTDSNYVIDRYYHLKGTEPKKVRDLVGKIMSLSTKLINLNIIAVNRTFTSEAHDLCNSYEEK